MRESDPAPLPQDDRGIAVSPHVRLAMLRLTSQARSIRERLAEQALRPGTARRSWPWVRATLASELETATVHALQALQSMHEAVFASPSLVSVSEVRRRMDAMNACLGHILGLHRDVAAALEAEQPGREAMLAVVATPLLQIADFFDRMQRALDPQNKAAGGEEIRLAIDLEFAAQLSAAESAPSEDPWC